jgi:hypothetical protein
MVARPTGRHNAANKTFSLPYLDGSLCVYGACKVASGTVAIEVILFDMFYATARHEAERVAWHGHSQ